jgi:O-antigen/teichoic acid export membrane protein
MFSTLLLTGTNLGLRGFSLAARFLIILILARALGPSEFGVFTIIQTTEIIAILVLGFEFNAYSRREIINAIDPLLRGEHIRNQIFIAILLGLISPAIAFGSAFAGLFPINLAMLTTSIIFFDMISQEGIRILYALQRTLMANIVYFVRSSAWAFLIMALFVYSPRAITISLALEIWAAFSLAAILVFFWSLRKLAWSEIFRRPINWQWISRGFVVALPFFVSTACVNILSYLPRYILFYTRGADETGIFGLYAGIAVGVVNLLSTITIPSGVAQATYAFTHHGKEAFDVSIRRLWIHSAAMTVFLSSILVIGFPFILPFVGTSQYPMDWTLLTLLVIANSGQVASIVAQTALYAMHRDRQILIATLVAGGLSVGLQFGLASWAGMHGLAAAMALSMLILSALLIYFGDKKGTLIHQKENPP